MTSLDLSSALRLVFIQALVTFLMSIVAWLATPAYALYVLSGGLIAIVANTVFALMLFTGSSGDPYAASGRLLGGEMVKLMVTAVLIALFMWWKKPPESSYALTFMMAFLMVYLLPGILSRRLVKNETKQNTD